MRTRVSALRSLSSEYLHQPRDRIVKFIDDALFEWNDSIVGDRDMLGANFGAAFCYVAVTDAEIFAQLSDAVFGVERVHFERRDVDEKTRADKFVVHFMIAQHMADVLTQKTFDALAKFLHAVDVRLLHPPGAVLGVGRSRLEFLDAFLDFEIPRHVRD